MHPLVDLAKQAVENHVENGKIIPVPEGFPKEFLEKKAGTFVTIEKDGRLRGCVGTYLPVRENIGEEIIHNAIAAATEDYRFGEIKKTELPHLAYSVYILNPPEPVKDISELDPKKFGIIIKAGLKCGLLLPDLAGIDTVVQQIAACCQKADIFLKQESPAIYKFTAQKYDGK